MKKIAVVLSLIMICSVFSIFTVNAASCNHNNKTRVKYLSGGDTCIKRQSCACGKKYKDTKMSHNYGATRITNTSGNTHTFKKNCLRCNKEKRTTSQHRWTKWENRKGSQYHWQERHCKDCAKYQERNKAKHRKSSGGKCSCGKKL